MGTHLLVETKDLVKVYGDGVELRALDGVSLQLEQSEFVAIMGPSGSGKSTLLNMLGALDRPTSGTVIIGGQDLAQVGDVDAFRARTVGFVFQMHNLIPTLTAMENIEVPMMGQPLGHEQRRRRAKELLELVGMGARLDHLPGQLSGGERQRVAIARALANRPVLVLADEPTGNLDSQSGAEVIALMRRLNRELGTTFALVTHDSSVARQTDRILQMRDGRIVREVRVGSPIAEDLRALRESDLGQALREGQSPELAFLDAAERDALRRLLESRKAM